MFETVTFFLIGFLFSILVLTLVKKKRDKKDWELISLENRIVDRILDSENAIPVGELYNLNNESSFSSIETAINDLISEKIIHIELRSGIVMFVYGWIE